MRAHREGSDLYLRSSEVNVCILNKQVHDKMFCISEQFYVSVKEIDFNMIYCDFKHEEYSSVTLAFSKIDEIGYLNLFLIWFRFSY